MERQKKRKVREEEKGGKGEGKETEIWRVGERKTNYEIF